ncbi:YjbQ family protein [Acidianus sulfidivorans JP7]|uniref:YjbQ family protein n=1 Tax=Acidianus sulfidivorans JP7 TaxID=619593 RepID=A0A2U9IM75_9CREN|nr:secondary thiamine-phosphate synthase enzyme YjbQ [Acidianus sulfidivorans]AWR97121.1 YjbQ family protein [Acidianus sulfidivorans JP7]
MKIFEKEFQIKTHERFESIDITNYIEEFSKNINDGIAFVFVKHTTCSIIVNEAESGLMKDYINWAKKLVPPEGEFNHNLIDNNGHAHILSAIIGNSRSIPIKEGKLDLGTWQRIILLEFDGPRVRTVNVKIIGE